MTSIHLTISNLDAVVEVEDAQLGSVQERLDAIYADLLTDLTNLGMVVDVKRAERWVAYVDRALPDFGCGATTRCYLIPEWRQRPLPTG